MKKFTFAFIAFVTVFLMLSGTVQAQITRNFEGAGDSLLISTIGWGAADISAKIAVDPLAPSNKVLKNIVNNYNAAPVLKFVLPAGKTLANYGLFTFKGYFAQGDVGYKDIVVEAYKTKPAAQFYNNTSARIGTWARALNGSSAWENITVNITGSASITDTFYIAFGFNCAGTGAIGGAGSVTTWYADDVTLAEDTTLVPKWGFLGGRQGNWKFTPGAPGSGSIGGDTSLNIEWGAIRGEFNSPITATTTNAIVVTGNIEFVGAGIDTWSGLRYGLFNHTAAGTLITSNVDSTRWSGAEASCSGYMFSPVSGINRVTDGVSGGLGTQWIRVSGNYISTSSGSGPIVLGGNTSQKPVRAVATAGVYAFAFSVQPLSNGTKEVRFYLIKGTAAQSTAATYYFGGSFIDTTSVVPTFNGVVFAAHTAGSGGLPLLRSVKLTNVKATIGSPITVPEAPWSSYYVDKWGFMNTGYQGNWHFHPGTVIGNAGIGGDTSLSVEWGAIRGELFEPVTATNAKALIVTGKIEFVGAGIDTWSGLRYGIFQQDSAGTLVIDSARATLPDSTRWELSGGRQASASYSHGYMFSPVSGINRVTDGVSGGLGTNWIRVNGSFLSTSANSGPIYFAGNTTQKPVRAIATAGVYEFAFSVQPLANGTKEVRFYLIKGTAAQSTAATYYFGGSFIDTTTMAPKFNSLVVAVHATGSGPNPNLRGVNLTDVKVDIGAPITVPEAPWSSYYVDKWGFMNTGYQGNWHFHPGAVIGNAGIGGDTSLSVEWGAIRGEFFEPVTATNAKALIVTGKIEFVGAGIDTWSGLRYGIFQQDSAGTLVIDSARATLPDSTRWELSGGRQASASYSHGYMLSPVSGINRVTDGVSGGLGTNWIRVNGSFLSTGSGSGPIYFAGNTAQKPARAVATAGVYEFAFSVQPQSNGTKEVRFYLIKGSAAQSSTSAYYFGDKFTDTTTMAAKFNSLVIAIHATGSGPNPNLRGVNLTDVKVDIGAPITIPVPPWGAYYVDKWGFYGGKVGGWKFTPDIVGNGAISGTSPNIDWSVVRAGFIESFTPTVARPLKITGEVQFVGGGFETANSFRFGIFQSDVAGTVDSSAGGASSRWTGPDNANTGYLFVPPSSNYFNVAWNSVTPKQGNWGAVANDVWFYTNGANSYALGSAQQAPGFAVAGPGTYSFAISVKPTADGKNDVKFKMNNGTSYVYSMGAVDNTSTPTKFNSIVFGLYTNATTTAMKLTNVKIDTGTVAGVTGVETSEGSVIPKEYAMNQNYPNPFNPSTTIQYDLPMSSHVTLTIYDMLGREVSRLVNEVQTASRYFVQWNASNVSTGVYFYRIDARSNDGSKTFTSVKKLLLVK